MTKQNKENSFKLIYTVSEVSSILGVNKNSIYKLINSGLLKTIKLGRIKITDTSLNTFLKTYDGYDLSNLENIKPYHLEHATTNQSYREVSNE